MSGSVSAEAFLAAGHDVVVLDDLTTGHRAAVPQGARLHVGSYGDGATVARLLTAEGIEAILHCAARSLVSESIADPARYFRDNVAGGITLLEAAREAGVDRVVFSSTAAVYGVPDAIPVREDAPLRPINPYGETKRSFEGALAWYGRAYGMRSVTLRYFNVAGATDLLGEDHDPETHLIPTILRCVEAKQPVTIFGADYPTPDGTCIRDYIHVVGPGRRAPAGDRCHGSRRFAHVRWRGRSATSATATASASGRSWPPPSASSARASRTRSASAGRATRPSSSRQRTERWRSLAGAHAAPRSTTWSVRPGPGARTTRVATAAELSPGLAPMARRLESRHGKDEPAGGRRRRRLVKVGHETVRGGRVVEDPGDVDDVVPRAAT